MRHLLLFVFMFAITSMFADGTYPTKVQQVTIFRQGAQLIRTGVVTLKKGQNEIILSELPAGFDESTIQVGAGRGVDIQSVSFQNNFGKSPNVNPVYQDLTNQLQKLIATKEDQTLVFDTWREEESLLLSNKKVTGDDAGLVVDQLTKMADVYRLRLLEVKKKLLESKRELAKTDENIKKTEAQLKEWNAKNGQKNSGEIVVNLIADIDKTTEIKLTYIDRRASWSTSFDLRLENLNKPLVLANKASVNQTTGEDWSNVDITLATGNPNLNTVAPTITPWYLYFANLRQYDAVVKNKMSQARPAQANVRQEEMMDDVAAYDVGILPEENVTFMEYKLQAKQSLTSDNKMHEFSLRSDELVAEYKYFAVPSQDCRVYLIANIPEWNKYNLSSGEIKLYFEGTFIGKSYLNASETKDTLQISLGPDIAVNLTKEKIKDFNKTKFLSTKKEITNGYEWTIKNNKPSTIEVEVKERIPIATDAEMEVDVKELSGGKLEKETGIVTWAVSLKPGEQVKRKIIYAVKIPKHSIVNLGN